MTDTPTTTDPVFDTSTAAGRLRILWGATADPQLAMSDDEVADVATVLREHAEMAAEPKRLRTKVADLDDCLTATAAAKGSNRYAGRGQLITLLTVDDVREMIGEWREAGTEDA